MDIAAKEDRELLERLRGIPPGREIDGWSWLAEPAHQFFGESAAVWVTEDRGHEGDRGAGGPFLSLVLVSTGDAADAHLAADLTAALKGAAEADLAFQFTFVEVWRELAPAMVKDPDHLAWLDEIPPGQSAAGRRWTAKATLDRDGRGWVMVSFDTDADDPRLSKMLGMAQFRVG